MANEKELKKRIKELESQLKTQEVAMERLEKLNEAVHTLETKLVKAVDKKVPSSNEKATRVVSLPKNIEVDPNDKYNTSPKPGSSKGFFTNAKHIGGGMFKEMIKSKMFWIIIITLPIIFTFIEYLVSARWGFNNDISFSYSGTLLGVKLKIREYMNQSSSVIGSMTPTDYFQWFLFTPILIFTLIIFPSYISRGREENTFKRQALIGVTRSQTYYYYVGYGLIFTTLLVLWWIGPWSLFLDYAADTLINHKEYIGAAWGGYAIEGTSHHSKGFFVNVGDINGKSFDDVYGKVLVAMQFVSHNSDGVLNTDTGFYDFSMLDYSELGDWYKLNELFAASNEAWDLNPGYLWYFRYIDDSVVFGVLSVLFVIVLLHLGYNKGMKAHSSQSVLGWGIGLWIFTSFSSGGSVLLSINIIQSTFASGAFWNTLITVFMFAMKWMFIFTLPSLLMTTVVLAATGATGFAQLPGSEDSNLVTIGQNHLDKIVILIYIFTVIWCLWVILRVFINKRTVMSYETAR